MFLWTQDQEWFQNYLALNFSTCRCSRMRWMSQRFRFFSSSSNFWWRRKNVSSSMSSVPSIVYVGEKATTRHPKIKISWKRYVKMLKGCCTVRRAVATDTSEPRFKSSRWQCFGTFFTLKVEKRVREWPIFNLSWHCLSVYFGNYSVCRTVEGTLIFCWALTSLLVSLQQTY